MTGFGLITPRETLFGRGLRDQAAARVAEMGRRILVVRGRSVAWVDTFCADLIARGCDVHQVVSQGEPKLPELVDAVDQARAFAGDCVIAIGGGAVIDLGKAIAGLAPSTGDPVGYLEIVGTGQVLADPLPFVAMPTTFGTGAEATKNAVITVPDRQIKVSLRDARLVPILAIVDPALTDNAPRALTLASGLDAVTQLIESYLCIRANPFTDAFGRDAIGDGMRALVTLMAGEDAQARDDLARASYLSGVALANSGLGIVHGLAAPIGGQGGAHGAICGRLLAPALDANRRIAADMGRDLTRFDEVSDWIGAALGVPAGQATGALRTFVDANGLPDLAALNCPPEIYADMAEGAANASSSKANPVPLTKDQIIAIMADA